MSYAHIKAWRLRNPEYNKLWMRKYRGSKLAEKNKKIKLAPIVPPAPKYKLPEDFEIN
jgi:hypothetical protein